jgi:concanavalin A-like lectin/glucanase superfamily protein
MVKNSKSKIKKIIGLIDKLDKPFKVFLVALIIGVQCALFITYFYSIYRNQILAGEGIRDTLTYQGKITNSDGVPPPDGLYNLQFKIYDQLTSGTLLWTETWDSTNQGIAGSKVTVTEGIFTIELNSLCGNWVGDCSTNGGVTFAQDNFYLQMELDYDTNGTYEEVFSPRKRFTATPYSMNTDKLDGYDSGDFILKVGDTFSGDVVAPNFIENSLICYYQFNGDDEDSGSNDLDGALQNSASVDNGILELNGTNQYYSVADDDLLSFVGATSDDPFSISAWVNMTEATNFEIVGKGIYGASGAEYQLTVFDTGQQLGLYLYDSVDPAIYLGRYDSTDLEDFEGIWTHIGATYDGSEISTGIKLYINGNEISTVEGSSGIYTGMGNKTADLYIGRNSTAYSEGKIDDVRVYDRELSDDEIKQMYEFENRVNIYSESIETKSISFSVLDDEDGDGSKESEGGNLSWDTALDKFKFDQELFAPNVLPYFNNSVQDRDYTHLVDSNKILAYDFHESVGTTTIDLEGNSDGSLQNGADWTNDGYIGYGIEFDGDDSNMIITPDPVMATTGTIEFWAKLDDYTRNASEWLFFFGAATNNRIDALKTSSSDLHLGFGAMAAFDTGYDFTDNNWHHFVIIWEADYNIDLYVDSVDQEITTTHSGFNIAAFDNFYLGSRINEDNGMAGTLDSLAIYTDVLTETEIGNHYNAAFNNLYVSNILSDGDVSASLSDFYSFPYSDAEGNEIDPVYFTNSNKKLGLAFSEGSGGSTAAEGGSGLSATISGATWTKEGYYGYGLEFDGVDDNLVLVDHNNFDVGTGDFTFEFWVKGDDVAAQTDKRIISKKDGDAGYELFFNTEGGGDDRLGFFIGDGTNTVTETFSGIDRSDGNWHNIMYTFDRTNDVVYVYVDGAQSASKSIATITGSLDTTTDVYIASDSSSNYYNGALDSIVLTKEVLNLFDSYNRTLNSGEFFIINHHQLSAGQAPIAGINQSTGGYGGVFYNQNSLNSTGSPLSLWTEASYTSGSDAVYNLINFSTTSGTSSFGNLLWDSTNSQFVFDQSLKTNGDLTSDYLQTVGGDTSNNEFLAFDIIRHTIDSTDVTNRYLAEAWSKATTKKVVNMHAVGVDESDANDKMSVDDSTNAGSYDHAVSYDGTNITVYDHSTSWAATDIVTIFIVYEK